MWNEGRDTYVADLEDFAASQRPKSMAADRAVFKEVLVTAAMKVTTESAWFAARPSTRRDRGRGVCGGG